jgi:choline dehydrogenase-like flavoprotein
MLVDARTVSERTVVETDVCIVGAGAAGITLAREFIGKPFRICLLESGGFEFDKDTQDLCKGESAGFYIPLDVMRLRYFGGTTNHWGNYCRPLDEMDFEARDWVPHSGWPFKKYHLDPFYQRAQSTCQIGPFAYEPESWEAKAGPRLPIVGDRVITTIFQMREPPIHFGTAYRDEVVKADNIKTMLHANVLSIETDRPGRTVTSLRLGCLQGNNFTVKAKLYILAAGAIENARLLLLSNGAIKDGLGNQNGLVGRFFMSHALSEAGLFLPSDPFLPANLYLPYKPTMKNGLRVNGHLSLSPGIQREQRLLNFNAALFPASIPGWLSLKRLKEQKFGTLARDLKNIIGDIDGVAKAAYGIMFKGVLPVEAFSLTCAIEQSPNPASRVTLGPERDALGKPRIRLDWKLTTVDRHTLKRSLEVLGMELGRAGLGRIKVNLGDRDDAWPSFVGDAGHHIGTTRMHVDPKKGVVDENCRLHGVRNLFVAGSSVFPTCGHANPTLTIVALALRLADHVKGIMT